MKKIDLHVHTNRSDGGKSIDEIMSLISDGDTISITDHNIIGNYNKIINGIELEGRYKKKRFHFLLLDFDVKKMNIEKNVIPMQHLLLIILEHKLMRHLFLKMKLI